MWTFPLISWLLSLLSTPIQPRRYYTLYVESDPIESVPFTIDDSEVLYTPWSGLVEEGEHIITFIDLVEADTTTYIFARWENLYTEPQRVININSDKRVIAYFVEVPVEFSFAY